MRSANHKIIRDFSPFWRPLFLQLNFILYLSRPYDQTRRAYQKWIQGCCWGHRISSDMMIYIFGLIYKGRREKQVKFRLFRARNCLMYDLNYTLIVKFWIDFLGAFVQCFLLTKSMLFCALEIHRAVLSSALNSLDCIEIEHCEKSPRSFFKMI